MAVWDYSCLYTYMEAHVVANKVVHKPHFGALNRIVIRRFWLLTR